MTKDNKDKELTKELFQEIQDASQNINGTCNDKNICGEICKACEEKETFSTGSTRESQEGKIRYDLIPPFIWERLAKHYTNGAKAHGDRNWEKGQPIMRLYASSMRHKMAWANREIKEDHLIAEIWNDIAILFMLESIKQGKLPAELDDRPWYMKPKDLEELDAVKYAYVTKEAINKTLGIPPELVKDETTTERCCQNCKHVHKDTTYQYPCVECWDNSIRHILWEPRQDTSNNNVDKTTRVSDCDTCRFQPKDKFDDCGKDCDHHRDHWKPKIKAKRKKTIIPKDKTCDNCKYYLTNFQQEPCVSCIYHKKWELQ